jgi:hypothetical protein
MTPESKRLFGRRDFYAASEWSGVEGETEGDEEGRARDGKDRMEGRWNGVASLGGTDAIASLQRHRASPGEIIQRACVGRQAVAAKPGGT